MPMGKLLFAATLFILTLAGCKSTVDSALTTAFRSSPIPVKLELIVSGLNDPVFMTAPPKDTTRLFIVEQGGRIRIYDALRRTLLPTPFLDISPLITSGGERGLLASAFDPNYDANRQFYVYYTNINGDISIARCL